MDSTDIPFASNEEVIYDILVPTGRNAVVIRVDGGKPVEIVKTGIAAPKDSLMLLVSRSLVRALFERLVMLRLFGLKTCGIYVVMPSTDEPRFVVPWRGKASRAFFRSEATSPYNSKMRYAAKWVLASLGLAPFLQHCFVLVCGRD